MFTHKCSLGEIVFFGKVRGNNGCKFNRASKLLSMYDSLIEKMDGMMERGSNQITHQYRLALCVKLMMTTGIRIGNESSAEGYTTKPHPNSKVEAKFVQTYGLTTMKKDHVAVSRGKIVFNFLGKKQVENTFTIKDRLLVKQIKRVIDCCGEDSLFDVTEYELNKFIKKSVGRQFSPKDFRTMRANIYAWTFYSELPELPTTKKELNEDIKEVATKVSEMLNNTPSVCKKSYIDDRLFDFLQEERWYKFK